MKPEGRAGGPLRVWKASLKCEPFNSNWWDTITPNTCLSAKILIFHMEPDLDGYTFFGV